LADVNRRYEAHIADLDMLRRPLVSVIESLSGILRESLQQAPLSVCLLSGAVCSPTVVNLIGDAAVEQVRGVQDAAAGEWAKRKADELKPLLESLPRDGASLCFLFALERSLFEAGGLASHGPLDARLRVHAHAAVVNSVSIERVEARAERLYRDFCLLLRVLAASGHAETRRACVSMMNPIDIAGRTSIIEQEVEAAIGQSRGLIKLILGGRPVGEPKSEPVFDPDAQVAALFGQVD